MVRAVIFDLDGTIIDNEALYGKAFCAVLKKLGVPCGEVEHTPGIGVYENWVKMKEEYNLAPDPAELTAQTQQFFLDNLDKVRIRPGFVETARYLKKRGLKVGLATSNTSDIGHQILEALKLDQLFDSTTFGDEVPRKKPAPDLFLKALEKEGFRPPEAVVIEDSPAGIAAAKNAGTHIFAFKTDRFNRIDLARADQIIEHFRELRELV